MEKRKSPCLRFPIIWMRLNEVLKKLDGILREILENKVNRLNGFRFNRCKWSIVLGATRDVYIDLQNTHSKLSIYSTQYYQMTLKCTYLAGKCSNLGQFFFKVYTSNWEQNCLYLIIRIYRTLSKIKSTAMLSHKYKAVCLCACRDKSVNGITTLLSNFGYIAWWS